MLPAEPHLDLQNDALKNAGCEEIYTDIVSGMKAERPGLEKAMSRLRKKDTLVIWKLDRLSRSIQHLIQTVKSLQERQVGLQSLQEHIDTTTSTGKLIFHIFSSLAEFERDLLKERTEAGLKAARARGKVGGRPPRLNDRQVKRIIELYDEGKSTVIEICKIHDISRPSFYNYLNKHRKETAKKN